MTADAKTVTVMEIHLNFKTVTVTVIWGKYILENNKTAGNNFDSNGTLGSLGLQSLEFPGEGVNLCGYPPKSSDFSFIHFGGRSNSPNFQAFPEQLWQLHSQPQPWGHPILGATLGIGAKPNFSPNSRSVGGEGGLCAPELCLSCLVLKEICIGNFLVVRLMNQHSPHRGYT